MPVIFENQDLLKTAFFCGIPHGGAAVRLHAPGEDGVLMFEGRSSGDSFRVCGIEILDGEDAEIWKAWKELIGYALKSAEAGILGSHEYDLLITGSLSGPGAFQPANLAQWLSNQSRQMAWGESRLVPYAGLWGQFRKLAPLDWGKIRFKDQLQVLKDRSRLDLVLKRLFESASTLEGPVWVVIHDLSRAPVFRFGDDAQTPRLRKVLEKYAKTLGEKLRGVYYIRAGEVFDLLAQFETGREA